MEFEHINKQNENQKWDLILKELDLLLVENVQFEHDENIIKMFENVNKDYREKNATKLYSSLWKIAYRRGKVKLAKEYVDYFIEYLIEYKRIPLLKSLQKELQNTGLVKSYQKTLAINLLAGDVQELSTKNSKLGYLEENYSELHPEIFRDSKVKLKIYLYEKEVWNLNDWKLCYEYIIKFYFEKDLFLRLYKFSENFKKETYQEKLKKIFQINKEEKYLIAVNPKEMKNQTVNVSSIDYDQIALSLMSGIARPEELEQKRILVLINQLSDSEIIAKGKDMAVAFSFLGMDLIVTKICRRMIGLLKEINEVISIYYILGEAYLNCGEFYEVIELASEIESMLPLNENEKLVFNYLKAESYFQLGKKAKAKTLFMAIKKNKTNYRMVNIRLKLLESIK